MPKCRTTLCHSFSPHLHPSSSVYAHLANSSPTATTQVHTRIARRCVRPRGCSMVRMNIQHDVSLILRNTYTETNVESTNFIRDTCTALQRGTTWTDIQHMRHRVQLILECRNTDCLLPNIENRIEILHEAARL